MGSYIRTTVSIIPFPEMLIKHYVCVLVAYVTLYCNGAALEIKYAPSPTIPDLVVGGNKTKHVPSVVGVETITIPQFANLSQFLTCKVPLCKSPLNGKCCQFVHDAHGRTRCPLYCLKSQTYENKCLVFIGIRSKNKSIF